MALLIILLTSFIVILLLIGTILTHIICSHHILHYAEQDKNCKIHLQNVYSISKKQQNCFKKKSQSLQLMRALLIFCSSRESKAKNFYFSHEFTFVQQYASHTNCSQNSIHEKCGHSMANGLGFLVQIKTLRSPFQSN